MSLVRKTFAIISHPDAGKTTLTEQLLLLGGAIHLAGTVKARKSSRHATSDWMALEKQRGISVTTSVMQFPFNDCMINLLDTPGHADFSEDTYRTLTAVDSALMVIDAAKGVEERTIKLLGVCRLRQTPIMTFLNKLDRNCREPIELLDEIEAVLNIQCAPITWPIGMGQHFKGIYHLYQDIVYLIEQNRVLPGLANPQLTAYLGVEAERLREDIELLKGASHAFDETLYLAGKQTPVFVGSAMNQVGTEAMLDAFTRYAPAPLPRATQQRTVMPNEKALTACVFKIQANMDPAHHDRMAFARICSGTYRKGMKLFHVRLQKEVSINQVHTFMAGEREQAQEAQVGDIIGLHNHGTIQIGDTFTEGEALQFTGIPSFAPELFRCIQLADPLKAKALHKGLLQLAEEGAVQFFRSLLGGELIIGAIGSLQFDVVAYRLQHEYGVACRYGSTAINTVRWVSCEDKKKLAQFKDRHQSQLALDASHSLTFLATSRANLQLTKERWGSVCFSETREHTY